MIYLETRIAEMIFINEMDFLFVFYNDEKKVWK